jgi:ABC-2 type transport system ATP-binding protein
VSDVIVVEHLSRNFGAFRAVDDVSFEVRRGEIFGYLGANGAGKSTTIRMLTGLLAPSGGRATVSGIDVANDPHGLKASIGYMSQKFSLYLELPVIDNLRFFGGAYGLSSKALRKRIPEVLALTGLDDRGATITATLPGGIRQRLALSCALLHAPEIVFLDEPTAGVDPEARRTFWRIIGDLSQAGTTVFVTTHYLDEAEYCERIGLMVDGKLAALDTPAALKRDKVPGALFVVRGRELGDAGGLFAREAGVFSVAPFGAGLHLRVEPERWNETSVTARLHELGAQDVELEATVATLEDVFLEVVGGHVTSGGGNS